MNRLVKPMPVDREINLNPNLLLTSKADAKDVILFANEYFMEISGYDEWEVMGQSHHIFHHPDMPELIFKWITEQIGKDEKAYAVLKNIARDGRFYWVLACFQATLDNDGNIIYYKVRRKAVPENAKENIAQLYKILKAIEKKEGVNASEKYMFGFLEELKISYENYIFKILNVGEAEIEKYFNQPVIKF